MITGINLLETEDFVSKYDEGDQKTVWKLGVLDSEQFIVAMANENQTAETMGNLIRFGLKGFENFKDAKGNDVKYKTEQKVFRGKSFFVLADDVFKIIPTSIVIELGIKILSLCRISEGEQKN